MEVNAIEAFRDSSTVLISGYEADGQVTVRAVVGADVVDRAHRHLAGLRSVPGREDPHGIVVVPLDDPFLGVVTADAGLARIVTTLLGPTFESFGCTYIIKPPRVGLPVLWHQDGHPWKARLGRRRALTVWLALEEATPANGCLRVVPGSHRMPARPLRPNRDVPNVFGYEIDRALVDVDAAVDIPLRPGDASVHHPNLVHGSDPNRSDRSRTALAFRFAAGAGSD